MFNNIVNILALPHSWVTNTPSVKILYPQIAYIFVKTWLRICQDIFSALRDERSLPHGSIPVRGIGSRRNDQPSCRTHPVYRGAHCRWVLRLMAWSPQLNLCEMPRVRKGRVAPPLPCFSSYRGVWAHGLSLCMESFLGEFEKLRKATISFVLSVRPSWLSNSAPTRRILMKLDIWAISENLSRKFNGYFTWRRFHIYDSISLHSS